jgi:hypothetical protein
MRAPLILKSSLAKRLPWVVLTPLVLGGCLPLPITIVSTAFTGVSYLATGKSTTDHVLSATVEEDCSLINPIFGEDICQERSDVVEDNVTYAQVAQYPGDRDDGFTDWSHRSVDTEESGDAGTVVAGTVVPNGEATDRALDARAIDPPIAGLSSLMPPAPVVTVAGLSLKSGSIGTVSGIVPATSSSLGGKLASADPVVSGALTDVPPATRAETWAPAVPKRAVEIAPLAAPEGVTNKPKDARVPLANPPKDPAPASAPAVSATAPAVSPAPEVVKLDTLPIDKTGPVDKTGSSSVPKVEIGSMGESGRYVVVGSFRDRERAESLVARLVGKDAKILAADVKGERWNRVAMGPFPADEAVSVKRSLGSVGGREPWVAKLSNPIVLANR